MKMSFLKLMSAPSITLAVKGTVQTGSFWSRSCTASRTLTRLHRIELSQRLVRSSNYFLSAITETKMFLSTSVHHERLLDGPGNASLYRKTKRHTT